MMESAPREAPMHWVRKGAVCMVCCLGTAVMMMLLMRQYDAALTAAFGLAALASSAVMSWFTLRRWRLAAPLRCVAGLGICAGIGGAGLYILALHGIVCLFTPRSGLISNPLF